MKLAIITHVEHIPKGETYFGYSAYVREINIWGKYASELIVVAPVVRQEITKIHLDYAHKNIRLLKVPVVSLTSIWEVLRTLVLIPVLVIQIWRAMRKADHIHLRCPGNLGLVGCCVQVLFPKKPKTAKYAGNWDPNAKQPRSYRWQKWILSNTFLTRNMKVLVYGAWPRQTKNVQAFFTASYPKTKVEGVTERSFMTPLKFMFVGSLSSGKRPVYALQLIEALSKKGVNCELEYFGEGVERANLETYIKNNSLEQLVKLHGNQTAEFVEESYKNNHFLILPSQSEGWPKVVAEAMFWGCIPIATKISCVPWMLDNGNRGVLIEANLEEDVSYLLSIISEENSLKEMSKNGQRWSQEYTLDKFEEEIQKFL
ncbi:MAG: glycosyltransferase [Flavobacteriaceae bacterium]|nr:glycosyltransferase [Flavobacteriaceae bacterium]